MTLRNLSNDGNIVLKGHTFSATKTLSVSFLEELGQVEVMEVALPIDFPDEIGRWISHMFKTKRLTKGKQRMVKAKRGAKA